MGGLGSAGQRNTGQSNQPLTVGVQPILVTGCRAFDASSFSPLGSVVINTKVGSNLSSLSGFNVPDFYNFTEAQQAYEKCFEGGSYTAPEQGSEHAALVNLYRDTVTFVSNQRTFLSVVCGLPQDEITEMLENVDTKDDIVSTPQFWADLMVTNLEAAKEAGADMNFFTFFHLTKGDKVMPYPYRVKITTGEFSQVLNNFLPIFNEEPIVTSVVANDDNAFYTVTLQVGDSTYELFRVKLPEDHNLLDLQNEEVEG